MTWPESLPPLQALSSCPRCEKPWIIVRTCLGWELTGCWIFGAHLHASCPMCSREALYADTNPPQQALAARRHGWLLARRAMQKQVFIRAFLCDAEGIIERLGPLPRGAGRGILTAWVWKNRAAVRDLSELLVNASRVGMELEAPVGQSSLCRFDEAPAPGRKGTK